MSSFTDTLDYDEWRQELVELLPKKLLTHASDFKLRNNSLIYTWYNKVYTVSLGDIWDYRLTCKEELPPLELLERWVAYSTPLEPSEKEQDSFWVINEDLQWNAVIYRGTYALHHKVHKQSKPRKISFTEHFTIEHKGAIISVLPKYPCPAPSTALSYGTKFFAENIDPLYSYSTDMCIAFKDPFPLLFGNKDALTRLLEQGNHPYTQLFSLEECPIKENHEQ